MPVLDIVHNVYRYTAGGLVRTIHRPIIFVVLNSRYFMPFDRGFVVTENETYFVEPETNTLQGGHFVYRQSDSISPPAKCGKFLS